jgi:L-lactate permease
VKRIPPVVTYTVLRLLTFAVPLALLLLLNFEPWVATVLAAIIGLSVSYIFLRKPREKVAAELYERRHGNHTPDTQDEDAEDGLTGVADAAPRVSTPQENTKTDAAASVFESGPASEK